MIDYTIVVPILISVFSLVFGVYQYADKRRLEKTYLQIRNKAAQLELREKEVRLSPTLVVFYLESTLGHIYEYSRELKETLDPLDNDQFREVINSWASELQGQLPFEAKVSVIENSKYSEIMEFCRQPDEMHGNQHLVRCMLIRNEGGGTARAIRLDFHDASVALDIGDHSAPAISEARIEVESIGPREAIIVFLSHSNVKTRGSYGIDLEPKKDLEFVDSFLDQKKTIHMRAPYETAKMIDTGILLRG